MRGVGAPRTVLVAVLEAADAAVPEAVDVDGEAAAVLREPGADPAAGEVQRQVEGAQHRRLQHVGAFVVAQAQARAIVVAGGMVGVGQHPGLGRGAHPEHDMAQGQRTAPAPGKVAHVQGALGDRQPRPGEQARQRQREAGD